MFHSRPPLVNNNQSELGTGARTGAKGWNRNASSAAVAGSQDRDPVQGLGQRRRLGTSMIDNQKSTVSKNNRGNALARRAGFLRCGLFLSDHGCIRSWCSLRIITDGHRADPIFRAPSSFVPCILTYHCFLLVPSVFPHIVFSICFTTRPLSISSFLCRLQLAAGACCCL